MNLISRLLKQWLHYFLNFYILKTFPMLEKHSTSQTEGNKQKAKCSRVSQEDIFISTYLTFEFVPTFFANWRLYLSSYSTFVI